MYEGGDEDWWGDLLTLDSKEVLSAHQNPDTSDREYCHEGRISAYQVTDNSIPFLYANFDSDLDSNCSPFGRLVTFNKGDQRKRRDQEIVVGVKHGRPEISPQFDEILATMIWLNPNEHHFDAGHVENTMTEQISRIEGWKTKPGLLRVRHQPAELRAKSAAQ